MSQLGSNDLRVATSLENVVGLLAMQSRCFFDRTPDNVAEIRRVCGRLLEMGHKGARGWLEELETVREDDGRWFRNWSGPYGGDTARVLKPHYASLGVGSKAELQLEYGDYEPMRFRALPGKDLEKRPEG